MLIKISAMKIITLFKKKYISEESIFMFSVLIVNGGNYLYNLLLGRILGPKEFSDAAILITMLLVLSFVAMTFQLVVARFSVTISDNFLGAFMSYVFKNAIVVGIVCGILVMLFANQLQMFFNTTSSSMFVIFGCGVPLYFLMSVNRGFFQGKKEFKRLSITYQAEMLTRLLITLLLLNLFNIKSSVLIALGVFVSLLIGLFPLKLNTSVFTNKIVLLKVEKATIKKFFIITAFYELSQIVINNSDIILVKHYFDAYEAGLYASLALIGRIVYFVAWMFVMLLLPTVVQLKKEGKPTTKILTKYVLYISLIAASIVFMCKLFPVTIVQILFGNDYTTIAPLLWRYALATGMFAVANIFAYYFLSLDKYVPVVVSALFGALQLILIIINHSSLSEVVNMQIYAMSFLLFIQLIFFFIDTYKVSTNGKK